MNITKYLAEEVASKMVEPLKKKMNDLSNERTKIADEAIMKSIPKDVIDCYKRFLSYFCISNSVTLHNGSYEKRVSQVTGFPSEKTYYPYMEADLEIIQKIENLDLKIDSIKKEKEKVFESVVSTLLSLRTFKRAKESFPEAYKYMSQYEDQGNTAIALPIDNILSTLKKYSA